MAPKESDILRKNPDIRLIQKRWKKHIMHGGKNKKVSTNVSDIKESEGKLKITIGQAGHLLKNLLLPLTAGKKNERDANNCPGSMKSFFCLFFSYEQLQYAKLKGGSKVLG